MKKTIFVHIGIGKTGTTAVQRDLYSCRDYLNSNSCYVPLTGLVDNKYGHQKLAVLNEDSPYENTLWLYEELSRELTLINSQNIIISTENF